MRIHHKVITKNGATFSKSELDGFICPNPQCDELHPRMLFQCGFHRGTPAWVSYDRDTGLLRIECVGCDEDDPPLAEIVVAAEVPKT